MAEPAHRGGLGGQRSERSGLGVFTHIYVRVCDHLSFSLWLYMTINE